MRVWIGVAMALSVVGLKWSSLRVAPLHGAELTSFVWSPVISVASWRKRRPSTSAWRRRTLATLLLLSVALVASWWLHLEFVPRLRPSTWVLGYLGAVPVYLLIHVGTSLLELAYSSTGWIYPPHMRWPMLARSIDAFWGRRWGTWVSDWCREVIFLRYRRRPLLGMLLVFVASGLWHEVIIDVPLFVFCGINVLGGWLLYFLIQAAGAAIESRLFHRRRWLGYVFALAVTVLPAPLAMNEATLRALGLYV